MFRCENCGTGFNPTVASISETCPRCKAGGVEARLSFRLFEAEPKEERDDGATDQSGAQRVS
jgi:hypothetical protein